MNGSRASCMRPESAATSGTRSTLTSSTGGCSEVSGATSVMGTLAYNYVGCASLEVALYDSDDEVTVVGTCAEEEEDGEIAVVVASPTDFATVHEGNEDEAEEGSEGSAAVEGPAMEEELV